MKAKKEVEFVLSVPPLNPGLWKFEGFSFLEMEYLRITDMKTGESMIGRVLEPKGELHHVGNWRDARRFTAFEQVKI